MNLEYRIYEIKRVTRNPEDMKTVYVAAIDSTEALINAGATSGRWNIHRLAERMQKKLLYQLNKNGFQEDELIGKGIEARGKRTDGREYRIKL